MRSNYVTRGQRSRSPKKVKVIYGMTSSLPVDDVISCWPHCSPIAPQKWYRKSPIILLTDYRIVLCSHYRLYFIVSVIRKRRLGWAGASLASFSYDNDKDLKKCFLGGTAQVYNYCQQCPWIWNLEIYHRYEEYCNCRALNSVWNRHRVKISLTKQQSTKYVSIMPQQSCLDVKLP